MVLMEEDDPRVDDNAVMGLQGVYAKMRDGWEIQVLPVCVFNFQPDCGV